MKMVQDAVVYFQDLQKWWPTWWWGLDSSR